MRSVRRLAWSILSAVLIVAASLQGLAGITAPALAAAGDLDSSFGIGGKLTTQAGPYSTFANAVAVQSDGKIVVVGGQQSLTRDGYEFAIARYKTGGALDPTFGTGGRVLTFATPSPFDYANAVVIQPDGKIVVGGYSSGRLGLVRLNTDGSLDATFATSGKLWVPWNSGFGVINALAIQPDGSIVAAGQSYDFGASHYDVAVARITSSGTLDATFGTGGTGQLATPVGPGDNLSSAVALQSDGKIVVAGRAQDPSQIDSTLVRYETDGTLDSTFGSGGKVITAVDGSNDDGWNGVAIDAGGKIVTAGYDCCPADGKFSAGRYNSDGSLDSTFGTGGTFTTPVGPGSAGASSLVLQSDGKIVAAGPAQTSSGGPYRFAAVRLTTSGALDGTYGSGGIALGPDTNSGDNSFGAAIQSDDQVVVVGTSAGSTVSSSRFATTRFATNGTVDSSFGSGGLVETPFGSDDSAAAVTVQTDGKIVSASNFVNQYGRTTIVLSRFNQDGTPDTSFGSDGQAVFPNPYNTVDYFGTAVAQQQDGKLVVGGDALVGGTHQFTAFRFNADGSVDTGFGSAGAASYGVLGMDAGGTGLALQDDGVINVSGSDVIGAVRYMMMVGFNPNGSVRRAGAYDAAPGDDAANAIAVQPDGKILMAGYGVYGGAGRDLEVLRLTADGLYDATFNGTGSAHVDTGSLNNTANAIAVQPNGAIVLAGTTQVTVTVNEVTLARFTSAGAVDATFGTGGVTNTTAGSSASAAAIGLTPTGSIVAGGTVTNGTNVDGLVTRYTPSGTLDTSFADYGRQTIAWGPASDSINGLAVQTDGRVVVAGGSLVNGTDVDTALARLQDGDPSLSVSDATKLEGDSGTATMAFTVSLSTTSRHAVTFSYSTQDGTAHAPGDYLATSGTGTILAGQSSATINVPIVGDTKIEPDETFQVGIGSPTNASISRGTATGTIQNDDGVAISAVPSAGPPGSSVSVSGTNFGASEAVDLYFDSANVGLATANGSGSFTGSLTVPMSPPGSHVITAVGRTSGLSAQANFTVRSDWPQFRGSPTHQGVNKTETVLSSSTVPDLQQGWTADATGAVRSPVEGGGLVFATADGDGTIHALDPSTGTEAWHLTAGLPWTTAPAYGNGEVFAGISDGSIGEMVAFDAQTGAIDCGLVTAAPINTDPSISGHNVYFGTDDGSVYGMRDSTCTQTFLASMGGAVSGSPTVGGGRVWAVSGSTLTGFKISNPANTVSFTGGGDLTTPAFANGVIYVGSADGKVSALNAGDSSVIWQKDQSTPITSGPAVASGTVVVGGGNGKVIALKATKGTTIWSSPSTGSAVRGDPTIAGGVVYVGSDDNTVSAWTLAGKKKEPVFVWSATTGGAVGSSPAVVNGQVFAGSADGTLYEYDLGTGPLRVSIDPGRLTPTQRPVRMIIVRPARHLPVAVRPAGHPRVPPAPLRAGAQL